jgi:hypothetical protein
MGLGPAPPKRRAFEEFSLSEDLRGVSGCFAAVRLAPAEYPGIWWLGYMAFYARYVLPRIIDLVIRNKGSARLRAAWIPQARGQVLEVGIGSGLNLPFYSREVQHIHGVDPSLELQRMTRKRLPTGIHIKFLPQSAEEQLPLADASIHTVVVTWTLCSIANPPKSS